MEKLDVLAKLDSLYHRYVQEQSWRQAAQNRMQVAAIAYSRGRTDLFREYSEQAIILAQSHTLHRFEIEFRLRKFNYLLMLDLTGQVLDELRKELSCKLGVRDAAEVAILNGALSRQLDKYEAEALNAYDRALARLDKESLKQAQQQAVAFALVYLSGQIEGALDGLDRGEAPAVVPNGQIRQTIDGARTETARICASLRIDLYLLAAEFKRRLGDSDTAEVIFQTVEEISKDLPEKRCAVYMAWSDRYSARGNLKEAIRYAEKAVETAQQVNIAALKAQASAKLGGLLDQPQSKPSILISSPGMGATEQVTSILARAHHALIAGCFQDALTLVNDALPLTVSPQLRRMVLRERAIVYYELGCFAEAEADFDESIALLSAELSSDIALAKGTLDSRIQEEENLHLMKAWLKAKAGQGRESWDIAEQGRSRRLKREIAASANLTPSPFEGSGFESMGPWLGSERAAILSFAATRWGTLALTVGPDDAEPEATILDRFPFRELKRLLDPDLAPDSEDWTRIIFNSVPDLSAGLIHPMLPRLRAITQSARVLYIIPDSLLYYAPLAALTLGASPNSPTLMDLCPLAITPSAGILLWCASRRGATSSRDCLAVAVGKDSSDFEFHNHLTQIAAAPWPKLPSELRDAAATVVNVTAQAPNYPVLYFSCHGAISPESQDVMAASRLELADKQFLNGRDVSTWRLHADLVFLNACQSGRFRLQARSDVNGFMRAFLLAGVRTFVAPVIHVNPSVAGDLAEDFFREWLAGTNTAESLRRAQFAARQRHPATQDWAAYYLAGDYL